MSDIRRQDEPSMEEILASIRRIIAEDNKDGGTPSAAEQDILELTDRVEADGSVVSLATRMAPRAETREPPPIAVAPYEPAAKAAPEPELTVAKAAPASDSVISAGTAAASIAALSELTRETSRGSAMSGDRALEEATRELLKPLLKAWLDTNLPPLIERIVREEIARLAREAGGG
ncbi:MAG: DUF2497 domain-containing protein [Alphaproteobacteria bacterium]|nr:DUF2497 domain-containing protein [Alphaproteobacteria bacterium]